MQIEDRDLYQLLLAEFRYAVKRDNHLAPSTCVEHVKQYLPDMEKGWRAQTAKQLSEEIIDERLWASGCFRDEDFKFEKDLPFSSDKKQLHEDYIWEELLVFLTNYITTFPHNMNRYMEHIYDHMTYSKGIDYYSIELAEKIQKNQEKA
jgi:hypothetical protein